MPPRRMLAAMTPDGPAVPWTDTPENVALARVVWREMSALQRAIWRELVERSPEAVDGAELALALGLTTPERVHGDPAPVQGEVAGVLLAATRHFGRPPPLRSSAPATWSRALYVDADSAAPWRRVTDATSSAE